MRSDAELKTSKTGYLRLNVRIGDGDDATCVNVLSFDASAIEVSDRLVKGARLYVEGRLSLDEWTSAHGTQRHGLSVLSFHTRTPQIGRNKQRKEKPSSDADTAPATNTFHSDEIGF